MPSTSQHTETYDAYDSHSVGSESDIDPKKYISYVQYKKKGGGTIALFPSNSPSKFVVNAVTGVKYDGVYAQSRASRNFFRVVDASSPVQTRVSENGTRVSYNPRDPNTFYYNSPEEYVKYAKIRGFRPTVSKSQMFAWHQRNREVFGNDDFLFVGGDGTDEIADTVIH